MKLGLINGLKNKKNFLDAIAVTRSSNVLKSVGLLFFFLGNPTFIELNMDSKTI